jgi:hypothetical protein
MVRRPDGCNPATPPDVYGFGEVVMDPVTLIVAALAAGASAGLTDAVSQAMKDVHAGLKSLVLRRVQDQPAGEVAVIDGTRRIPRPSPPRWPRPSPLPAPTKTRNWSPQPSV